MNSIKEILLSPEMRRIMPEGMRFLMRRCEPGANENLKTSSITPARLSKVKFETQIKTVARSGRKQKR